MTLTSRKNNKLCDAVMWCSRAPGASQVLHFCALHLFNWSILTWIEDKRDFLF